MIYVLTTDSYTHYHIVGVFQGPEGINVDDLAAAWAREFPEKTTKLSDHRSGEEYFDAAHFKDYVIKRTGLIEIEYNELWLPTYSLDMKHKIDNVDKHKEGH